MKVFILLLTLFANSVTLAASEGEMRRNDFIVGCLSWEQVEQEFDFSQITKEEMNSLQRSHQAVRRFLNQAQSRFSVAVERNDSDAKQLICSFVEEATHGFQDHCLDNQGREMLSAELVSDCLSIRFFDDQRTS